MSTFLIKTAVLYVLVISFTPLYANGWGDWSFKSKKGTFLSNDGSGNKLYINTDDSFNHLTGLNQWYFYKDCILGVFRDSHYFIVYENEPSIQLFNSFDEWNHHCWERNLVPEKCIIWHQQHNNEGDASLFLFIAFSFIITFGIICLYALFQILRFGFNLNRKAVLKIILFLVFLFMLLSFYVLQFSNLIYSY